MGRQAAGLRKNFFREHGAGGRVDEPPERAVGRLNHLRRQLVGLMRTLQNGFQGTGLIGAGDHENDVGRGVGCRRRECDAVGVQLADPVARHDALRFMKRLSAREERKRMAFISHTQQDQIETRKITRLHTELTADDVLVLRGRLRRVGIFALDAVNLLGTQRHFREHGVGGHLEIAVRVAGADVALIAKEHLHFIPRKGIAQGGMFGKEGIQHFGSGATGKGDAENATSGGGIAGNARDFVSGEAGDFGAGAEEFYGLLRHRIFLWRGLGGLGRSCRGAFGAVFLGSDVTPGAAVAFEQVVGFLGSPGAGSVIREAAGGQRLPDVDDGFNDAPCGFDHVGALEQGGIADHAVVEQAFVTGAVGSAEVAGVVEIHVDQAELHDRAGNFGTEAERDAFVGLNVNDQLVGPRIVNGAAAEQSEWSAAEADGDFRDAMAEAFAGAEIKGDIAPAPVVNFKFHGYESFGIGVGGDVGFAAVGGNALVVDNAFAVLAADGVLQDFFRGGHLDGVEDFGLFVADGVGVEGDGGLHGGKREELEEMVGNHVAESAGGFVEGAAVFDANGFGGGNLDVVDVGAVPERFDNAVGETENHDVLDGFFAEVMVDAVDLLFTEDFFQFLVELNGGFVVVAERFFDDDADPVAVGFLGEIGFAEFADDEREELRRDSEVMKQIALGVVLLLGRGDLVFEALVGSGIAEVALDVVDTIEEPFPQRFIERRVGKLLDALGEFLAEGIGVQLVVRKTDDGELLGKEALLLEIHERRQELALGQVAAGAVDNHDAGRGFLRYFGGGVGVRHIKFSD